MTTTQIRAELSSLLHEWKFAREQREALLAAERAVDAVHEVLEMLCPSGDPDAEINGADFIDWVTEALERNGFFRSGQLRSR